MNLFILDADPIEAAAQYCDLHVCKIILEVADMLCLAHWETNGLPEWAPGELLMPKIVVKNGRSRNIWKYRSQSQVNNHVSIWVRSSTQNYMWAAKHGIALCNEYEKRYGDNLKKKRVHCHATKPILVWFHNNPPELPNIGLTEFRQAVAREPHDCYKPNNPVAAYREYYIRYKSKFAKWRLGNIPDWYGKYMLKAPDCKARNN